jgi:hypothetical protein
MLKTFIKNISCSPLSCIAIYLVIIGMILAPIYSELNRIESQLNVIYKILINPTYLHEVQSVQVYPLNPILSLARAQATP